MGIVCGRRVFKTKKDFFWRRVVCFWRDAALRPRMVLYPRVRACCIRTKSARVAWYTYVLGICTLVCAFGPRAREKSLYAGPV